MWAGGVWVRESLSFFWMLTLLAPLLTSSFLRQVRRLHSLLSMLCFVKWRKGILSKVLLFLLICNISGEEVHLPCKSVSRLISSLLPPCHPPQAPPQRMWEVRAEPEYPPETHLGLGGAGRWGNELDLGSRRVGPPQLGFPF